MSNHLYNIELLRNPSTRSQAFEAMVNDLTPQLYMHIRRIVQYHDDANDVLQNTYLKAWKALDSFRGEAQLSTWLFRIALNESISFMQRKRPTDSLSDDMEDRVQTLESDPYFDGDETELQLQQAIAHLPEKQRVVFNLRYFEEMKYEEMSKLLDTSEGALKTSYHLAVKKIEQYFNEHD